MKHSDIINLWPSLGDFADDIGVQYGTAKAMRRRNSIPSDRWYLVVSKAKDRKINGVSLEALALAVSQAEPAE